MLAGGDAGYISLDLDFDPSPVKGPRADRSRAAVADVTKSDLTLTLTHSSGAISPNVFAYDDFENNSRVNTGLYTLEAACGDAEAEGWDQAYFYGSTQLTVKNEQVTEVSLPVRLANSIVNVALSEGFTSYMSDYTVTVTSGSGNVYDWAASADRELYVKPGSVMVSVRFTKPNGMTATADIDPITAEARHRYNVTIDVEAGSAETLNVTFDDTVEEKEVELDISDSNLPMLAAAPKILTEGFQPGDVVTIVEGTAHSGSLKSTIVARGVIANAVLNVNSAYLKSKGWPESIDLANPGAYQPLLDSYGVKTLGLTGNKAVFAMADFSALVSKLAYVDGADNTSSFSLIVTDAQGKEVATELFSVNVEKLVLEILDGSEITTDGHATVKIHYNGGQAQDAIKLYAHNDRGTVDLLPFTLTSGAQADTYDLAISSSLITLDQSLSIYATVGDVKSDNYLLKVPSLRLIEEETNAFAKHAYVTVRLTNDEAIAAKGDVKFEVSDDGGNSYTEVASTIDSSRSRALEGGTVIYHLTGLTSGTNYTFRAKLADETTGTVTLSTEEEAQLPNAGMEDWEKDPGKTEYWWISYCGSKASSPWGTMNLVSTSQGGSDTGNLSPNKNGMGYCAASGTDQTSEAHGGNFAALIKTVGWGSGNTAGGATSSVKHMTIGSLHLGTSPTVFSDIDPVNYDDKISYGMDFASRPSELSFWYKYQPKNSSDYGYVEIWLKDSDNNIITRQTTTLTKTDSYEKVPPIKLSYANNKKAVSICVIFRSSGNPNCYQINKDNLAYPAFAASKGTQTVGSKLYIDDIELIYE